MKIVCLRLKCQTEHSRHGCLTAPELGDTVKIKMCFYC